MCYDLTFRDCRSFYLELYVCVCEKKRERGWGEERDRERDVLIQDKFINHMLLVASVCF